jgi:hypothetical protein
MHVAGERCGLLRQNPMAPDRPGRPSTSLPTASPPADPLARDHLPRRR